MPPASAWSRVLRKRRRLGNLVMQMVGRGAVQSIAEGREIVSRSFPPTTFLPRPKANWDAAYEDFAHYCRNSAH